MLPLRSIPFKGALLVALSLYYSPFTLAQPICIKKALICFEQEDYITAQNLIDEAIQDAYLQKQASTWYYRGVIYEQLMRKHIALDKAPYYLEEALQAYQKALNLSPQASQYHSFATINLKGIWLYYLNRGVRYYKAEAFDRAIEHFQICKRLEPQDPYAWLYTGIAAHQEEQYKLALEGYQTYLQLTKGSAAVYRGIANLIAYHLQDPTKAQEFLEQGMQYYPWDTGLLEEQNNLLTKLGQLEAKEQQYKSQLAITNTMSSHALLAFRLGFLYEQLDKLPEASIYYQQAVAQAPKQLEPICRLGIVYYNQAAKIIGQAGTMPEEEYQKLGIELKVQAEDYLKNSLDCFKQARKIKRSNLFIAKQLYLIYKRLGMSHQVKVMEAAIRRIKGGAAVLATLD